MLKFYGEGKEESNDDAAETLVGFYLFAHGQRKWILGQLLSVLVTFDPASESIFSSCSSLLPLNFSL
jgi:hypothetical protein